MNKKALKVKEFKEFIHAFDRYEVPMGIRLQYSKVKRIPEKFRAIFIPQKITITN